jgi:thiamine biosynthesis lipoprotein
MTGFRRTAPAAARLRLSLGLIAAGGLAFFALAAGRGRDDQPRVARARWQMGTVLEIDAVGPDAGATERGVGAAFRAVEEVERRLSNWRADSELSRANVEAADAPVPLSPATWQSLSAAIDLARETGGAFDPTVGAVTEALGLTGRPIDAGRARPKAIGWEKILLDPRARTLRFTVPGSSIDSGGFGKGEALDRALAELKRAGITAARLNFGGQITIWGTATRAGRRRFSEISVAEPRAESGRELCRFSPGDGSVSTSGAAEKPGHLIDPHTGAAVRFLGSVTVLAPTGLRADALSTALFVLGPRAGLDLANRLGLAALFVLPRSGGGWELVRSRRFPRLSAIQS